MSTMETSVTLNGKPLHFHSVEGLKAELKARNLPIAQYKSQMIYRLERHLRKAQQVGGLILSY